MAKKIYELSSAELSPENQEIHNKCCRTLIEKLILDDMLKGVFLWRIREKLVNDEYGLKRPMTEKAAGRFVRKVQDRIKAEYAEQLPEMREKLVATLFNLLEDSRNNGDRTNARQIVDQIAKLTGANAPTQVNVKEDIVIDFGFDINGSSTEDDNDKWTLVSKV